MPEGPEVKIASDFLNDTFKNKKISKVEALTPYFREKYNDLISHLTRYLIGSSISSFTIGKNLPQITKQYLLPIPLRDDRRLG